MVEGTTLKYNALVIFNGITSQPNFMKIHQSARKLLGGTQRDRQTHRQAGGLKSMLSVLNRNSLRITSGVQGLNSQTTFLSQI
jgi:hypothetical protein